MPVLDRNIDICSDFRDFTDQKFESIPDWLATCWSVFAPILWCLTNLGNKNIKNTWNFAILSLTILEVPTIHQNFQVLTQTCRNSHHREGREHLFLLGLCFGLSLTFGLKGSHSKLRGTEFLAFVCFFDIFRSFGVDWILKRKTEKCWICVYDVSGESNGEGSQRIISVRLN